VKNIVFRILIKYIQDNSNLRHFLKSSKVGDVVLMMRGSNLLKV